MAAPHLPKPWVREGARAVRARGATKQTVRVWEAFAHRSDSEGVSFPGLAFIAADVQMDYASALVDLRRRHIRPLVAMGALVCLADGEGRDRAVWQVVNLAKQSTGGGILPTEGEAFCHREGGILPDRTVNEFEEVEEGERAVPNVERATNGSPMPDSLRAQREALRVPWAKRRPPPSERVEPEPLFEHEETNGSKIPDDVRRRIDNALPRRASRIVEDAVRAERARRSRQRQSELFETAPGDAVAPPAPSVAQPGPEDIATAESDAQGALA